MKRVFGISVFVAVALVISFSLAQAVPINPLNTRPIDLGAPSGGEHTVQFILDAMFGPGVLNATTNQSPFGMWGSTALLFPSTIPTVTFEEAGFAAVNRVGVWSGVDSTAITKVDVFLGPAAPGTRAGLTWDLAGKLSIALVAGPGGSVNVVNNFVGINPFSFGFYLQRDDTSPVLFYTVDMLNPGGLPQTVAYNVPSSDTWAIAFEDQPYGTIGTRDFNDFVLRVESVQGKVPEPISLILLGSGLAGAGLYRRFRKPRG